MQRGKLRVFHRCQDTKIALNTLRVVIANIAMDHLSKVVFTGKSFAIIAFTLQNTPETFHRAVINAMCHTGHTLRHTRRYKLVVEGTVGVL